MATMSQLDYAQVIKSVYDEADQALQVSIVAGSITASNPSVGPTGSPVPAQATQIAGIDGSGNLQPATITPTGALKTDSSATTQPVSGTVTSKIEDTAGNALTSTASALDINIKSSAATLTTISGAFTLAQFVRNDYSSVAVTTAAYVTLIASTSSAYKELEIFDSSGQTLKLALGAAASEVPFMLVTPGGNGRVSFAIPSGSRLSIKAVSANASVGELDINLRG